MELLEGYELVKLTDDEIVQRQTKKVYTSDGKEGIAHITMRGNPHPDPELRQKFLNDVLGTMVADMLNNRLREKSIGV